MVISECYEGLDYKCLFFLLAKGLGTTIFILSFTLKIPQIFTIVKNKSTEGLSKLSTYLDLISVFLQGLYCIHKGLPFTIYGEYLSLTLQNFVIMILYWYYQNKNNKISTNEIRTGLFVVFMSIVCYISLRDKDFISETVWEFVGATNIPFTTISRFSQISEIIKTKKSGSVSVSSFLMRTLKNGLKIVSLSLETDNYILIINQAYNGLISLFVVVLIFFYTNNKEKLN